MKRFVIITLALFIANLSNAQKKGKDTTLFTYGAKKVNLKEFDHGFTKNEKPGTKHSAKDVDDYLELYKKFKLKVQDAYDQGIDTTEGFKSELATYRKQIAKPYLTDKIVNDQLVKEAYERYGYEVRTSHILIRITPDAAPADTLKALAKLNELRNDIVSGKLDFANAAETFSEDPSAKDNRGDLGFATAFQLVYEYENQAYNTPVGQVSTVFRTSFGYHILKVVDRRPTKGDMTVKHIMIQTNPNPGADEVAEAKAKIDEVYKKLQAGEKFDQLVQQYSEDVSSATNNGELPPFSMTSMRLPEQFKSTAFSLARDGEYSQPIQTPAGFHIIKRVSLKPLASMKDMRGTILTKISRDSRQYRNTVAVYNRALAYYKVKENPKALTAYEPEITDSLLMGQYKFSANHLTKEQFAKLAKLPLFTLATKKKAFTVADFGKFLNQIETPTESKNLAAVVANAYKEFKLQSVMDYYENDLENINDTFAALYKEYREGILLFTLTDKKVWTKSVEDTVGLKNFYNQNTAKYTFQNRYDATIYRCATKEVADGVKKDLEANLTVDSIVRKYNRKNPLNIANPITGKFEKGDNNYANMLFETGQTDTKYLIFEDMKVPGGYVIIQIHQFLPSGKKTLNEARGPITSDYQNYLEKAWLETLMAKYPIIVDQAIYTIFKNRMTR